MSYVSPQSAACSEFARYRQNMVRDIYQIKMDAGRIENHQDAPMHEYLTWICPKGHLQGPKKDSARCLRTAMERAVDQAVSKIDFTVAGRIGKKKECKVALNRKLRKVFKRRRNATRLMIYRKIGVYLVAGVPPATIQPLQVLRGNEDQLAPASAAVSDRVTRYQLVLDDSDARATCFLDFEATAASIIAEFLFVDPGDSTAGTRAAGAHYIKSNIEKNEMPKLFRPDSADVRNTVVQSICVELTDIAASQFNLSADEEAGSKNPSDCHMLEGFLFLLLFVFFSSLCMFIVLIDLFFLIAPKTVS